MAISEQRPYSPFWGLLILVVALGAWLVYLIASLEQQETATLKAIQGILPRARQALEAEKRYASITEDLRQLAVTDTNANQIVVEFKLQRTPDPSASGK
jgi:hypothetical protein